MTTIACHLDPQLKDRLRKALVLRGREPDYWPVPVRRDDLRRLMIAAGISADAPENAPLV